MDAEVRELAELVRREDADLADELLAAGGLDVPVNEEIAPTTQKESIPAVITLALPATYSVDAILYAAADAINAVPRDVKPAIVAAFVRAKELGLTVEQVVATLVSTK